MSMIPSTVYNLQTFQQVPTVGTPDPEAPVVKPYLPKLQTNLEKKATLRGGLRASFGDDFARRLLGEDVPKALLSDAVTCGEAVLEWARGHAAALQAAAVYARGKGYADAAAFDPHAMMRPLACVAPEARAIIEQGERQAAEYARAADEWRVLGTWLCWQDAALLGEVLIEALAEVETTETEPRKWFRR